MRGFEIAKGYDGVNLPKRSTKGSAGYDFELLEALTLKPGEIKLGITGVKAYMNEDEVLKLYPRSSLPKKFGVTIPNNVGIIDSDYYGNEDNDGAIFIQLYNFTSNTVTIAKGTRVAQGIFNKYLLSRDDQATTVRNGGFGSTG
ncbi:MAG: dCTP deaminase domain-containing protein [Bacillota bacterium]